eukprot:365377-Chlamydomonas_euryale.AAC.3
MSTLSTSQVLLPSRAPSKSCSFQVVLLPSRPPSKSCSFQVVLLSSRAPSKSCSFQVVLLPSRAPSTVRHVDGVAVAYPQATTASRRRMQRRGLCKQWHCSGRVCDLLLQPSAKQLLCCKAQASVKRLLGDHRQLVNRLVGRGCSVERGLRVGIGVAGDSQAVVVPADRGRVCQLLDDLGRQQDKIAARKLQRVCLGADAARHDAALGPVVLFDVHEDLLRQHNAGVLRCEVAGVLAWPIGVADGVGELGVAARMAGADVRGELGRAGQGEWADWVLPAAGMLY